MCWCGEWHILVQIYELRICKIWCVYVEMDQTDVFLVLPWHTLTDHINGHVRGESNHSMTNWHDQTSCTHNVPWFCCSCEDVHSTWPDIVDTDRTVISQLRNHTKLPFDTLRTFACTVSDWILHLPPTYIVPRQKKWSNITMMFDRGTRDSAWGP